MKKEFIRMVCSIWFVLGVCFTFGLCFFSEIVMGDGSGATIVQILQDMSRSQMAQEPQLLKAVALRNTFSGYVTLFVPVISALPMIQILHTEAQSGYKRLYMSRKSRREYYWGKWIAGMLTGAFMLLFVAVLFHVFMALTIPQIDAEVLEMFGHTPEGRVLDFIKVYIGIFVYGAFSVIPAMIISSFTGNFYFVICLPFMFSYFWDVAMSSIARFLRGHEGLETLSTIPEYFFSRDYLNIAESGREVLVEGGRALVSLAVMFLIYYVYLNRRNDCGE
ncbi:MAG: hypothetical protein J1E62_04095 [Lachnospiraceae bacterium]|nr:hypothetical protein [Lachnospiraceae bacterium]